MMTRSRRSSIRKTLDHHKESVDTIEFKKIPERCELSTLETAESMLRIGLNQNEVGSQDKQDPVANCKDHDCSLLKSILAMSTDMRTLGNKFDALENFVVEWLTGLAPVFQSIKEKLEKREETVFVKTRGSQCPSPPSKNCQKCQENSSIPSKTTNSPATERNELKSAVIADSQKSDEKNGSSYAEKASKNKPANQNERQEFSRPTSANEKSPSRENKDKKTVKNDDVQRTSTSKQQGKRQDDENKNAKNDRNSQFNDDDQVLILSDSVLNGIDKERLGKSYNFNCRIKKCYTSCEIEQSFKDELKENSVKPTVTILHVGINDLKKSSPQNASSSFINSVKAVRKICPQTKVIVSSVAPTSKQDLDVKREAFNALNRAELIHDSSVSFLCHENLDALSYRIMSKDGIHPTSHGSSILARNLGRHICNMLWKVVMPKSRKSRAFYSHDMFQKGFEPRRIVFKPKPPPLPLRNRFGPFLH